MWILLYRFSRLDFKTQLILILINQNFFYLVPALPRTHTTWAGTHLIYPLSVWVKLAWAHKVSSLLKIVCEALNPQRLNYESDKSPTRSPHPLTRIRTKIRLPCVATTVVLQTSKRRGRQNATRRSTTSSRETTIVPVEALRQAA